ncbi:hypothetical protein IEO21_06535 [Rhodonia placenta]|uniref:Acetyl-CoA synthetase-like protein n=1 Tax=Rhodonia placenta TaxID=104341 RepID=A0A8H7P048_9APHY|nr:hypothetical protein IEO21_06535 [Postia placenta]
MSDMTTPPLDGSVQVLPGFLDFHARQHPRQPLYVFSASDNPHGDLSNISYQDFSDATHRIAHYLRPIPGEDLDRRVLACLLHTDAVFYHAVTVGAIRAGLIPFPIAPGTSPAAIARMLERTNTHRIISQPHFASLVRDIQRVLPDDYDLHVDPLPSFTEVFQSFGDLLDAKTNGIELYPPADYPIDSEDVILYLHSSGSTGFPKPIPQTGATLLNWILSPTNREPAELGYIWGPMMLPPFHTLGITTQLVYPLGSAKPAVLFTPRAHLGVAPLIPTPELTLDAVRQTKVDVLVVVPSVLEAWVQDKESMVVLNTIKAVIYCGGPLSPATGDRLVAAGVRLYCVYGGTEFGGVTHILDADYDHIGVAPKSPDEWQWMRFSDRCSVRWVPQDDGTYECCFMASQTHRPAIENMADGEHGYATSDLFIPHPVKPGLWRIVSRSDDVITLSTGEKIVPIQQQDIVSAHPLVKGNIMFGRGREQVGILIEPRPDHTIIPGHDHVLAEFRNMLWPQIEEANRIAPAHARIYKEMILVTDSARPLIRAAKGTIVVKQSLALYEEDINNLLSATLLRNHIMAALRASSDSQIKSAARDVQPNFVFTHPTILLLATAISALANPNRAAPAARSPVNQIETMIEKYTASLTPVSASQAEQQTAAAVVLITGSTGALGSYMVAELLADIRVARVYALNRGTSLQERQAAAFKAAGFSANIMSDVRLKLLSGDMTRDDFGLEAKTLDELRTSVTHVIHNAWRVDFNLALASFEPQIGATMRLLNLVPRARFSFVSSMSAAQSWDTTERGLYVPEEPLHDPSIAVGTGYGMSKFVVEEVLANARKLGYSTTSLRVGQICGSRRNGSWNTSEWVPSLVKSSISLGCLPDGNGVVSWIPIEAVARAAVDISLSVNAPTLVNIVHPHPTPARHVFGAIKEALESDVSLSVVPIQEWVDKLEVIAQGASESELSTIPAIKLLDFFRSIATLTGRMQDTYAANAEMGGLPLYETTKARALCSALNELCPLAEEDAQKWVLFWREWRFIP